MNIEAKRKGQINVVLHDQEQTHSIKSYEFNHKRDQRFRFIDQAFSSYIGMETLKQTLKEIYAKVLINRKREEAGLKGENQMLHMMFKGNPGTGKTSVAREIARLFHQMNLLSKGHLIEAERADLVGEYIGHTAQKTRDLIKKAMGGVLFIDEAYSLGRGGEKDFGKEAIDTLVKHMEDYHEDFVLILAGYPDEMDHFLYLNPGLKSRFPIIVDFKDYTIDELIEIAQIITEQKQYELTQSAYRKLRTHLRELQEQKWGNFSNGRYIRNKVEEAIRRQALRLVATNQFGAKDLVSLKPEDFNIRVETYSKQKEF